MNNTRIAVAIVLMCVICPIIAGYLMPADSADRTGYETGVTTNISTSMENDSIPAFGTYSGMDNNMFAYRGSATIFARTVEQTTTAGAWPYYIGAVGVQTLLGAGPLDISTQAPKEGIKAYSVLDSSYFIVTGDESHYDEVHIMSNGQVYVVSSEGYTIINVTGKEVTFVPESGDSAYVAMTDTVQGNSSKGLLYSDLSSGVQIEEGSSINGYQLWTNGRLNDGITMIVKLWQEEDASPSDDLNLVAHISDDNAEGGGLDITILPDGTIEVGSEAFGQSKETLGNVSSYGYIMVEINARDGTATYTGLMGMSDFTDTTKGKEGNSVTVEQSFISETFTTLAFKETNCDAAYYVVSTNSNVGSTQVMNNALFNPDDYYPDKYWMLNIGSVGIYGDSLTVKTTDGDMYTLQVQNGRIQPHEGIGLASEIPVLDLTIIRAPGANGDVYTTFNGTDIGLDVSTLKFDGSWEANLYLTSLETYNYNEYTWLPGNFGLDQNGFCLVGIMTSLAMFIAASLYGRRSGTKMGIALLVSGLCALVFFVMM